MNLVNSLTCDVSWREPVNGLWSDPARWSTNSVPTSTASVCITVEGSYTVIARDMQAARNVTIGGPGRTVQPSLWIEGTRFFTTGDAVHAQLSVTNDVANHGTVRLTSAGIGAGATLSLANGTLRNFAGARFESAGGAMGANDSRVFRGSLVNDGVIDVQWSAIFDFPGAQYVNNGSIILGAVPAVGVTYNLTIQGAAAFTQAGGSLDIAGRFIQTGGTFAWAGGAITGVHTPELHNIELAIPNGSTGTGSVRVRETVTLNGNVYAGQTVVIQGHRPTTTGPIYPTTMTSATGFTNAGTLTLTAHGSGGTGATLVVTTGAITNTGRIEILPADGGERIIRASLVNNGVVDVQTGVTFDLPSAQYVNNGSIVIGAVPAWGVTYNLTVQGAAAFTQAGGSMDVAGRFIQTGGTFTWAGGAITGANSPELHNIALVIPGGSTATGSLRIFETSTLAGNVAAGNVISVEGWRPFTTGNSFPATLKTVGAVTNNGIIRLTSSGFGVGATLDARNGALTNAVGARLESLEGGGSGDRVVFGDVTNRGAIAVSAYYGMTFDNGTLRNHAPATITGPEFYPINFGQGATFFGDGALNAHIANHGTFNVGHSPGMLSISQNFRQHTTGRLNIELGGSPANPGVDFDRIAVGAGIYLGGTLNVSAAGGACVNGGQTFVIMTAPHIDAFSNFHTINNGIPGRTITPENSAPEYRLRVGGPACPPPDATPPVIVPSVTGTLGNNGWYVSDVRVSWSVTDPESPVTASTGCGEATLTADHAGITYTCAATSNGGTAQQSVTVKRDATPPVVSASRAPSANANGWNNSDVTATYSASDALSGLAGAASATEVFAIEAANQSGNHTFTDAAGNSATASISGISIDKTPPVVTVTRSPLPDATGWNSTDVTVTYAAMDALSGVVPPASVTRVFDQDGANQGGSHTFQDHAGNSATGSITGININKTPPPAPSATGTATPGEIWPPNNKMVKVRVTICTGAASFRLRSVTNNETGSADVEGWSLGTPDLEGSVRATRWGSGNGRTYTLVYDALTASGGAFTCTVTVTVPHDRRNR